MVNERPITLAELKDTLLKKKGITPSVVDQVIQRPLRQKYDYQRPIRRELRPLRAV